jgi:hypothetical protein
VDSEGGCGRRREYSFKFTNILEKDGVNSFTSRIHVSLNRERELSRNVIQNASKPTLKVSMVSNIRAATTEGPRDRIFNRRNIGATIIIIQASNISFTDSKSQKWFKDDH